MNLTRHALGTLGLIVVLSLLPAREILAGTIKYPAERPAFRLELPEGWTAEQKHNGSGVLTCFSKNGDVAILLHTTPKNYTMQEAMDELPAIVRRHFDSAKDGTVDIKPPHLETGEKAFNGIPFVFLVAHSVSNDVHIVYSYFLFTTPAGKTFLLEQIIPADLFKANKEEFHAILGSVGPVD